MRYLFVSCLFLAVAACGGAGDDAADDQGDDGDDTADTCQPSNDLCTGDTICVQGTCENAFNRLYDVVEIEVTLPTTDPAGDAWDVGGGAPDIFVEVLLDTQLIGTTATADDVFSVSFDAEQFQVTYTEGAELWLDVYDEDLSANDLAFSCGGVLDADLLRGRALACSAGGATVQFRIAPRV